MVSIKLVLIIWFLYSLVSTILYIAFDNDTITGLIAVGPVGWILSVIVVLVDKVRRFFKYHYKKMSIWDDGNGNLYYTCIMSLRKCIGTSYIVNLQRVTNL